MKIKNCLRERYRKEYLGALVHNNVSDKNNLYSTFLVESKLVVLGIFFAVACSLLFFDFSTSPFPFLEENPNFSIAIDILSSLLTSSPRKYISRSIDIIQFYHAMTITKLQI